MSANENTAETNSNRNRPSDEASQLNTESPASVSETTQPQRKNEEDFPAEIILKHVGEFGRFQKLIFLGMCPFGCFFALVYFVQFFITLTPDHWCKVSQLHSLSQDERRNISIPKEGDTFSKCYMYDVDWEKIKEPGKPASSPKIKCKNGWEFDHREIPYITVTSERNWVCDKKSYPTIAQSIFFVGAITGGVITGWTADTYGRIPALILSNMFGCVGGLATTVSKDFWDFTLCRFITGMAFDNCFMMMFILALEYVGIAHRTIVANMAVGLYFGGTLVIMPWVAKATTHWKTYVYITSSPMLIVLAAPWIIPESARWLISRGKPERAKKIMKLIEKINGTKIPDDVMKDFLESTDESSSNETLIDMFKNSPMRLMMCMLLLLYGAASVAYDSILRISDNLGMDIFLTFSVTSLTELPSNIIIAFLLDRQGRKRFSVIPMIVAGALSMIAGFVTKGALMVGIAMIARFLIIVAYNTITQWAFEMLPTTVRASGSSLTHVCGFLATIVAPFVVYSAHVWHPLPFILIGILALISAGICMFLPETKGMHMPQTMPDSKLLFETTVFGQYYKREGFITSK